MPSSPPTTAIHAHAAHPAGFNFMRYMLGFGLPGLIFISIVDSSPIPLPIPGSTDILIILLAARSGHWLLLTLLATIGSVIGGYISYHAGRAGGMRVLERYVSKRYLKRITSWTENHSIIAVALPAILPPPMPLTAFMLAAGALKISLRRFMTSFTISRSLRHGLCAWLGMHYGRHIVRTWNHFYARWSTTMLVVIIALIAVSIGVPIYAMWKEAQTRKKSGQPGFLYELGSPSRHRIKSGG
jgi:membrane protein YqaA with SNARE-associated domain